MENQPKYENLVKYQSELEAIRAEQKELLEKIQFQSVCLANEGVGFEEIIAKTQTKKDKYRALDLAYRAVHCR